ncbi:NXPE family member 3 [Paramormyrops kingsleyae]|uniref:NXPE family member 3 n=1 Tax=Paramormyrops kingsleyae TaxID=1676925 RepID=UPI003B9773CA
MKNGRGRHWRIKTMWRILSKYSPLFVVLILSCVAFLLRNIYSLEKLDCKASLYQLQQSITAPFRTRSPGQLERNWSNCSSHGLVLSPEEAVEQEHLLKSIAWPEPHLPVSSLHHSSSPSSSSFSILPLENDREWRVGDHLEVLVHMRDFRDRPKQHGGDFLLARLHSPELGAGVVGHVVDHENGLYSVLFWLPWAGKAHVEINLVHPSEAVQVLKRLREDNPDRVYFKSQFRFGPFSETTICNLCLSTQLPSCNYTNHHTGEPWFCYKPKLLSCNSRVSHSKAGYLKHLITSREELFFQRLVNLKVPIPSSGLDSITVLKETEEKPNGAANLDIFKPAGFYYKEVWRPTNDVLLRQFDDTAAVTRCLEGKVLRIYGDSTVRQWFEYLTTALPDLKEFNLNSPKNVGPFLSVDSVHNILIEYRCHGPPIRFSSVATNQLRYVADELEGVEGGSNTVVVLSIWSHFSTFPVEVYIRRLRSIRAAVLRLLDRAPGTLVVLRTANPQDLDTEVSLYNSDWFSLQLDAILRGMFYGLDVVLVDAWEMTLAHHLPHALHPPPPIIKTMIDFLLSHICPEDTSAFP